MTQKLHPLTRLAKAAVENYVSQHKVMKQENLTEEMKGKAGVFVCIKKHDQLRGCIGTFEPTRTNIAEEIIHNAIGAALDDPRFPPVRASELNELDYSVDILTRPEPVSNKDQLDPEKYGIIVESGFRRGLLLPDLDGVDTVDQQISICRRKAGIAEDEPVNLYRFEVRRYK